MHVRYNDSKSKIYCVKQFDSKHFVNTQNTSSTIFFLFDGPLSSFNNKRQTRYYKHTTTIQV